MALDTTCLLSTVKNTSGSTKFFAVLPPHGRTLTSGEEITVFGNILEAIFRGDRTNSPRFSNALRNALDNGDLDIVSTPSPILYDETNDASKRLVLDGGAIYAVDSCWSGSSSSAL